MAKIARVYLTHNEILYIAYVISSKTIKIRNQPTMLFNKADELALIESLLDKIKHAALTLTSKQLRCKRCNYTLVTNEGDECIVCSEITQGRASITATAI